MTRLILRALMWLLFSRNQRDLMREALSLRITDVGAHSVNDRRVERDFYQADYITLVQLRNLFP